MPSLDVAINALRAKAGAAEFDKAVKKIQRGAKNVDSSLAKNSKSFTNLGGQLRNLAAGLVGLAGVYKAVGFIKSAVNEFASFELGLANVNTMLDEQTAHFLPQYQRELTNLSVRYGEATGSLTKGLYDVLSASVDAADATKVLEIATKAGTGGLTTTAVAADALTTIINAYGFSANDAEKISDIMFATVKKGKITFDELASSIGTAASIAATAGLSYEELSAAIATMTRAGISSDNAMTSLRGIITTFIKPTEESIDAAKKFGLELNSTTLQTLGLTGVMARLKDATAEETAAIFTNVRALLGASATRKSVNALINDYESILDSAGRTEEAFQKIDRTTQQQLERTRQAWAAIKRDIGEGIAPQLNTFATGFQNVAKTWRLGWEAMWKAQDENITKIKKQLEESSGWLSKLPGFGYTLKTLREVDFDEDKFVNEISKADEAIKKITNSTIDAKISLNKIEESFKDFEAKDITEGVDLGGFGFVGPMLPSEEERKKVEQFTSDAAESYRRLYDDLGIISKESYDKRIELLELEKKEYEEFIDDKILLEQWFNARKAELDREVAIQGDDFGKGFMASLEQMQEGMMTWGEVGAGVAQQMKLALGGAIKSMAADGASFEDAMKGFADSMLMYIADVISQMLAMQIIGAAFGLPAPTGGIGAIPAEKGDIYGQGRLKRFERGGILTASTIFPMSNGGVGLAGEAGMEGILPLGRDSQGRLGVRNSSKEESKTPIKIVNVVDQSMMQEYLNSASGERMIVNIMQRNKGLSSENLV